MKKAQVAMEFLATYGWAILVVLGAIGALAYFGVLNPGNWFSPDHCLFGAGIGCSNYAPMYSLGGIDGSFNATLKNNLGAAITVVNVTVEAVGIGAGGCSQCTDAGNNWCSLKDDEWKSGEEKLFSVSCPGISKGKVPRLFITIRYRKVEGIYEKEIGGEIQGKPIAPT